MLKIAKISVLAVFSLFLIRFLLSGDKALTMSAVVGLFSIPYVYNENCNFIRLVEHLKEKKAEEAIQEEKE